MNAHSLYIHLPFCASKCPYCDFHSVPSVNPPYTAYRNALLLEWQGMRTLLRAPPSSVYIGGGTPSVWPAEELVAILSALTWSETAEVTVEVNPGSLCSSWLTALKDAGVNRISIGVQALTDARLKQLGRRHTAEAALAAVEIALEVGFRSVSGDIIYGTAGHTENGLRAELERLINAGVHHISAYELSISDGTPLHRRVAAGEDCHVDEDAMFQLWYVVKETLEARQFQLYEVSNYAKSGHTSRHNRHYWAGGGYIGVGAGAHGFICNGNERVRYRNLTDVNEYIASKHRPENVVPFEHNRGIDTIERISALDHAREQVMLGLRTIYGFPMDNLVKTIPRDQQVRWHRIVECLCEQGLGIRKADRIVPTESGLLRADAIAEDFF